MNNEKLDPVTLHTSSLVIDTHADTPQRFLDERWDFTGPLNSAHSRGHVNLESARAGNLGAEFFAVWVDPSQYSPERYVERTLELVDSVKQQVLRHPAELALCGSANEILAAHQQGQFGVLLGVEGGHSIVNSLGVLRSLYDLGVRYMTLTWANSNDWAESCSELRQPAGLSSFGCDVVREMNRLGMMIDVSHASDTTIEHVLAVSRAPILATHSSARAVCDSPRNLSDDQLRAIAANGGAVMVNFYSAFVDDAYRRALNQLKPERDEAYAAVAAAYGEATPVPFHVTNAIERDFAAKLPRPRFEQLMAHFEHIIHVAGIDHVGIGTDFDGIYSLPEGIDSAADLPKITAALLERGHSAEAIRKVLGGNLIRVFSAVQAAAGRQESPRRT
ncbi:MAG: dipeptidase [Acidobacteriaceae bacterium]